MKKLKTWILVADGGRAQIFLNEGPGSGLRLAMEQGFVGRNAPTRDLVSDEAGRRSDNQGGIGRHGVNARTDRHDYEEEAFAKSMAEVVNDAARKREFDRLVIVAPPKALGDLRGSINGPAKSMVIAEVTKDLTNVAMSELPRHLAEVMRL